MSDAVAQTIVRLESDYRGSRRSAFFYRALNMTAQLTALICTSAVTILLALVRGKYLPESNSIWPIVVSGIATAAIGLPRIFQAEIYGKANRVMMGELWLCRQKLEAGIINVEAALNWRQFIQNEYNKAVDSDSASRKPSELS